MARIQADEDVSARRTKLADSQLTESLRRHRLKESPLELFGSGFRGLDPISGESLYLKMAYAFE